jgi:hypothetical protein
MNFGGDMKNIFSTRPGIKKASVVFLVACSILAGCLPVKITDTAVRPGKAGGIYHYKIAAKGGSGKYMFSLVSGALPSNVTLGSDGTIRGIVSSSGTGDYPFTVKVEDTIFKSTIYKAEQSYTLKIEDSPYKWTLIAHFAVDNNIDWDFEKNYGTISLYLNTLEDIKAADKDNVLQIIVMMDAYNGKTNFSDGYYYLSGGTFASDKEASLSEINSGSVDDSKAFLDWVAEKANSSERYIYSIFNHGGGFDDNTKEGLLLSIGIDDTDKDSLTHYEVGLLCDYLKNLTGKNISIFYPFACLMGGVELAYEVSGSVDYILFSEELFPAALFSYQGLEAVVSDPEVSAEELGIGMCDKAYQFLAGSSTIIRSDFTLSLVDESKMANLYSAIDDYATAAIADINSNQANTQYYNYAADNSMSMMENTSSFYDDFYYIDFGNYLSNIIAEANLPVSVKEKASQVISAYDDMVVYARSYNYPDATGMTIFHNIWGLENEKYPTDLYEELLKFGASPWRDYVDLLDHHAP